MLAAVLAPPVGVVGNVTRGIKNMPIRCSLGHENPDGSAFCDECGEKLTPASASTPSATAPATSPALVLEADNTRFDLAGKTEIIIGREDPVSNIFPMLT